MTAATVFQAERPDPGRHVVHHDVPHTARTMATSLLSDIQTIHRAQGPSATLAQLEEAERIAGRVAAGAQALRTNLQQQIKVAKGGAR